MEARGDHVGRQRFGGEKVFRGIGQVFVGLALPCDQPPQQGDDRVHVKMHQRGEQVFPGASGIQDDDVPAGLEHPQLLTQGLRHINHVAHQKAGDHGVESALRKGEVEGIGDGPGVGGQGVCGQGARFANTQHLEGEIGFHGAGSGILPKGLEPQVTGAAPQIQQETPLRGQGSPSDDLPPPTAVLPEGHQAVHQVVFPRDAGEHPLDVLRPFRAGEVGHRIESNRVYCAVPCRARASSSRATRLPSSTSTRVSR